MKRSLALIVVTLGIMAPARALAQACIGIPTIDRQFALHASLGLPENAKTYSVGLHADLRGPLSIGGQVSIAKPDDDFLDDDIMSIGGYGLYEISNPSVSLCPVLGLQYSTFDTEIANVDLDVTMLTIPIGLGIGKTLRASAVNITIFGIPQYLYSRVTRELEVGDNEDSDTDTENELAVVGGVRMSGRSLFGGLSLAASSANDWDDPVLIFTVGVLVGGR